jgi:hypothetical protein
MAKLLLWLAMTLLWVCGAHAQEHHAQGHADYRDGARCRPRQRPSGVPAVSRSNTKSTTEFTSPHHARILAGGSGGSYVRDRRVRQLYLPLGGRRFRSRHAYRLKVTQTLPRLRY